MWEDKCSSKPPPEVLTALTDSGRKGPQEPCATSEHRDASATDHDVLSHPQNAECTECIVMTAYSAIYLMAEKHGFSTGW